MAPLAVAVVVDRARALAFRARRRGALGARQPHVHRAAGHIEVHSVHRPRRRDPQDRRVQLAVPHRLRLLCRRGGGTIAGGPSAGHATHTKPGRATMSMSASDYVDMTTGKLNGQMAFMSGPVLPRGLGAQETVWGRALRSAMWGVETPNGRLAIARTGRAREKRSSRSTATRGQNLTPCLHGRGHFTSGNGRSRAGSRRARGAGGERGADPRLRPAGSSPGYAGDSGGCGRAPMSASSGRVKVTTTPQPGAFAAHI